MSQIPTETLSDAMQNAIGDRRVAAAVFTTYSFDPGFFEEQVLPILFEETFSHVEKLRRVQLEASLQRLEDIAVYYDRRGLITTGTPAGLDVRRIPITRRTGYFHPKTILLLLEKEDAETQEVTTSLLVGVLSANLTRSGWWENVECAHFEEVTAGSRCSFRRDLLGLFREIRASEATGDEHAALERIARFLRYQVEDYTHRTVGGRFLTRLYWGQEAFTDFLAEALRLPARTYNLEVISPYFDSYDDASTLRRLVDVLDPQRTRVFLPLGDDDAAQCREAFYDSVEAVRATAWGELPRPLLQMGKGEEGAVRERFVHAKVYRLFSRPEGKEYVCVGSVNLTQAGHAKGQAGNLEAAFLVETTPQGKLNFWLSELEDEPHGGFTVDVPGEDEPAETEPPALTVRFDWARRSACYFMEDVGSPRSSILLANHGAPIATLSPVMVGTWEELSQEVSRKLEALLQSTSFLDVVVDEGDPAKLLIQEAGMAQKPSLLLNLTAEEILRYWSLLSAEQRAAFLESKGYQLLVAEGLAPSRLKTLETESSLFDHFAAIFHAFSRLEAHVEESLDHGRENAAVYRMFGEKYDSLPSLLRKVIDDEAADSGAVRRYVTTLTARQMTTRLRRDYPDFFAKHPEATAQLESMLARGKEIRAQLDVGDDATEFLSWFERHFLREETAGAAS